MCNQIVIASAMMGACEAMAYARKVGLDPMRVLDSIGAGAAACHALNTLMPRALTGDFAPGFYVKHFIKDMGIALESATALGLGARCVFAGPRPPHELPLFLALSDVVASPRCRGVNTPFKVYTYLASGRPLVATRIATHTQLLDDTLAFLVEPTAEGLAAGIRAVLADPPEARRRAEKAAALIEREYSAARFREKVGAAYAAVSSP